MPNPAMREARDQDGNRVDDDRPRVGPADPATVHRTLLAQEAANKTAPAPPPAAPAPAPKSRMQQSMDNQELAQSAMIDKLTQ